MKRKSSGPSAFFNPRLLAQFALCLAALIIGVFGFRLTASPSATVRVNSLIARATATFVVNDTGDGDDAVPGNGVCETANGNNVCTLRAAIQEVNALPGDDTINFDIPGPGPHTINLTGVLPDLTTNINIDNASGESVTAPRHGWRLPHFFHQQRGVE